MLCHSYRQCQPDLKGPFFWWLFIGDGGFLLELASQRAGNLLGLDLFGHLVDTANKQAEIVGRRNL